MSGLLFNRKMKNCIDLLQNIINNQVVGLFIKNTKKPDILQSFVHISILQKIKRVIKLFYFWDCKELFFFNL